jgi:7-cyano-7-deazaguanine synthase
MEKAVCLLSGGLDSSVLLYSLALGYECYPLTVYYGQRHMREVVAARNVCEALNKEVLLRWKSVNLRTLQPLLPSALTFFGEIPEGHYNEPSMKQTVVPNRNMILLSVAAGYAEGIGAGFVAYAVHTEDHYIYPDCRPEFVESAARTIKLATDGKVKLIAPFAYLTKVEIVKLGNKLGVPFERTWSCYKGGERPCLRCGTCVERAEAFSKAGLEDPLVR